MQAGYATYWNSQRDARYRAYAAGATSWVTGLTPETAVGLPAAEVLDLLAARLGESTVAACLDPTAPYPSPLSGSTDGDWLRHCGVVGVNVRTIGSFLEVVKYALTLPDHVRGIHFLPVWEPGVVGSLYGMASWHLNTEFYSQELYELGIGALEDQLRAVISLLHAMGKMVGMDVIPHTDRFSEMVLANPDHFEWLQRWDTAIVRHGAFLHEDVQGAIFDWLVARGPATEAYGVVGHLWFLPEADRLRLFFGDPEDYLGRQRRRVDLVDWLYHRGYEPVPATMAPPYRGIEVDPDPAAATTDAAGRVWRDYRITRPEAMSRVFGPLTRYKLYGRKAHNRDWEIDFSRPRKWVWDYLTDHYAGQQARYGFDFMRGDMSHVQMRPDGVPAIADEYYDPLRAVKRRIRKTTPHFAYFAESFLAPDGYMAYGSEVEHLERSEAEVTLGNLQSTVPGSEEFWKMLRQYLGVAAGAGVRPAWTVITGDKDDPRFDHFHHWGELERYFTGTFLSVLPLYFSLGFRQRDRHFKRAANEVYTKLYVFREDRGDKSVSGPYRWGTNLTLFAQVTAVDKLAEGILAHLGTPRVLQVGESCLVWLRPASDGEGAFLFLAAFSEHPADLAVSDLNYRVADLLYGEPTAHLNVRLDAGTLHLPGFRGVACFRLA